MMNNYGYDEYDKRLKNRQRRASTYVMNDTNVGQPVINAYEFPRGHTFKTNNPIVIAVDDDPDYNSGPICGYCYVDWFKVNLNATEDNEK